MKETMLSLEYNKQKIARPPRCAVARVSYIMLQYCGTAIVTLLMRLQSIQLQQRNKQKNDYNCKFTVQIRQIAENDTIHDKTLCVEPTRRSSAHQMLTSTQDGPFVRSFSIPDSP
jgi:hypothetical protein